MKPIAVCAVFLILCFSCVKKEESVIHAVYRSPQGIELTADFQKKEVTVHLKDGRVLTLPLALSASGARYSDGTNTFWEHQGGAVFMEGETMIFEGKLK